MVDSDTAFQRSDQVVVWWHAAASAVDKLRYLLLIIVVHPPTEAELWYRISQIRPCAICASILAEKHGVCSQQVLTDLHFSTISW